MDRTLTGSAVARGRRRPGRSVFDNRTWIRVQDVRALDGGTPIADISDKQGRAAGDGPWAIPTNCDVGTVHVHLPVPDVVVPAPGEERFALGHDGGESEGPVGLERAVAYPALEYGEGGPSVVRNGDLAAAAVVGGRAGEGDGVRLAGLPRRNGGALRGVKERVVALAGEVAARFVEGVDHVVVDVGGERVVLGADRGWVGHLHVSRGRGDEGQDGSNGESLHFEDGEGPCNVVKLVTRGENTSSAQIYTR